jgi:aminoglycoside N3'-acetyltransferase
MEWSRKWRININADKTEYSIFSRLKQHPGHTILKLNTNLHLCETIFSNKSLTYILNNIGKITAP